ncbi:transglycosylase [Mycolicibacterium novocastrense]|uniref:Transglycosylase n=1 Tax=Mycolicibacterium novocastrense TaxID=59813 RepID=A0AAW5SSB7_MYCNV|nr:transglycosylase [Mycolicibacterium novocastrense]
MSDPLMAEAVAALARGHNLFAGNTPAGGVGDGPASLSARADQISSSTGSGGLPAPAVVRSGAAVGDLRRLASTDGALAQILESARADRVHASTATRVILDAARADPMPAGDTPMGRREAMARMVARLRAQHGHIVRSRSQARVLALRLRRLLYLRRHQLAARSSADAAPVGGGGRGAVLAAIRRALDIKGIHHPVARARWERGMDLVAKRESGYDPAAVNGWDSNAAKGTPSKGAWQFIEPTFRAYHEPGTSRNIHDLTAQAAAFINYAQGRYGVFADGSNLADRIQQADPRRAPRGY